MTIGGQFCGTLALAGRGWRWVNAAIRIAATESSTNCPPNSGKHDQ
jgi:hypothetical protein